MLEQLVLIPREFPCICTRVCDCQNPESKRGGVAHVSEECPDHNVTPEPHPDCLAEIHFRAMDTPYEPSPSDDEIEAEWRRQRMEFHYVSFKNIPWDSYRMRNMREELGLQGYRRWRFLCA